MSKTLIEALNEYPAGTKFRLLAWDDWAYVTKDAKEKILNWNGHGFFHMGALLSIHWEIVGDNPKQWNPDQQDKGVFPQWTREEAGQETHKKAEALHSAVCKLSQLLRWEDAEAKVSCSASQHGFPGTEPYGIVSVSVRFDSFESAYTAYKAIEEGEGA